MKELMLKNIIGLKKLIIRKEKREKIRRKKKELKRKGKTPQNCKNPRQRQRLVTAIDSVWRKTIDKVWRKGNPLTLLVGMQTSTATIENSVDISLKTGNRTAI